MTGGAAIADLGAEAGEEARNRDPERRAAAEPGGRLGEFGDAAGGSADAEAGKISEARPGRRATRRTRKTRRQMTVRAGGRSWPKMPEMPAMRPLPSHSMAEARPDQRAAERRREGSKGCPWSDPDC